jgi:preprotein translocase subunit SecD
LPKPPIPRAHPARTLVALFTLIIAIYAAVFAGTVKSDATWTPNLALDLEGGTQVILTPITTTGEAVSAESVQQAIEVIRQRIDSSGVAEAEITSQGGSNIVVAIPGEPDPDTLKLVRESAQLRFRPVIHVSYEPGPTEQTPEQVIDNTTLGVPADPSDYNWVTNEILVEFLALDCTDPANRVGSSGEDPTVPLVACEQNGMAKYILGPVEIEGTEVANASSGLRVLQGGAVSNEWAVNLQMTSTGASQFAASTERLYTMEPPRNQFAIVLDGLVIMAPRVNQVIGDGRAEISGSLTRESAATLANQLKFGALPLTFTVQSEEEISATLGTEQLAKGVLAGIIGLILVVVYSFFQYRALGLVTVGSLLIAGTTTYGIILALSWLQGYRLSLAGVAGLIVAIGITADSFIVYFERIKDELRDGRTLAAAVDQGWARARRTILASDTVNFLAAIVLYFLAVGGVRGFAFTLGLTTLIDLLVVFTFTHRS